MGLGGAATLFLVWQVIQPLLVIGAGILMGVLLDACVRGHSLAPADRPRASALALGLLGIRGDSDAVLSSGSNQLPVSVSTEPAAGY